MPIKGFLFVLFIAALAGLFIEFEFGGETEEEDFNNEYFEEEEEK